MKTRHFALLLSLWLVGCQMQTDLPMGEHGKLLFREGKFDEAIAACTKAIAQNPDDIESYTIRGRAYLSKGDVQQAIKEYNEAIRIAPNDAEAYYNRAMAYKTLGDEERWQEDEKRARQLDPLYAQAYLFTPHDENELAERVLANTDQTSDAGTPAADAPAQDNPTAESAVEAELPRNASASEEVLSRLDSKSSNAGETPSRPKKSISESLHELEDPLGLQAKTDSDGFDPFTAPSLGSRRPGEAGNDPYNLGGLSVSRSLAKSRARRAQEARKIQPDADAPREESRVSRRQIQQDINAGEINRRRLANRAYDMQTSGNSGYTASPFSGLTDPAFPQPRRATTGLQEDAGSPYGGNIGAKAGQGPLNPYGTSRNSTPYYSPTVPQPTPLDSRNYSPNVPSGPVTDFYFSP